ncbi:TonB-linked outer membrane protein, SusC/RagA family [Filimonas lacunae]|uniref:TonB-linked outer membrane protein, SusC/RagA family n=1 Tax=Filimonas lacunae TaxID=477680 RepID=A0A173MKT0_9BACT|nr:TonB-dependent receptor [Filimonas lacunae]BAV08214.1 outer membrane protein, nutrient binding [Filimonas lacunae]SIT33056.1 TonB-linked outer membrane protein, SusC/RagA family [Filimonas lacunae]
MKQKILLLTAFFMMLCLVSIGQTTIKGVVKDSSGNGIAGVSVQVKGTAVGTVTTSNGEYSIAVKDSRAVLEFSFIGYGTQTILVNGRNDFSVTLLPATGEMDAVVVVGYGSQKKKDLTGSVAVVSAADLANRPLVNAGEALQGKAAGVQVTSVSGKPGAGLSIRVRGSSSISAGNDPLYVVDGIPMTDISAYNPNDIESISILKDAASAAIYGTRAANGVVVITTKKGKNGQSRVDLTSYYGTSTTTKKLHVLNAKQYQDYANELYQSTIVTDAMVAATDINWQDEVFKTGNQQNYQVAVSGGSEKTQHYLSLGYMDQTGMVKPASFNRMNARLNLSTKVSKWLTLNTSTLASRNRSNDVTDNAGVARGGVVLSALATPSTVPYYQANGQYIGQNPQTGWENPLGAIKGQYSKTVNDRFVSNLGADATLLKGLVFQSRFGIDYKSNENHYYRDPVATQQGRTDQGSLNETTSREWVWLSEQTLNYTKNWNSHHFSALAGWSAQDSHFDQTYISASRIDSQYRYEDWNRLFARAKVKSAPSKTIDEWGLMSYFGRVTYDYAGKYLFQANMRVDKSSKFAPGNRTAAFPSFSAGWRISEENFMKNVRVVSDLKLRASWGKNGNQEGVGSYEYLNLNNFTSTGDQSVGTIAPLSLTWEKTTQTNVGIDAAFLNKRLTFTADFYVKRTNDVLVRVPLSGQIVSSVLMNSGSMRNIGEEFVISSKNILKKDFSWTTDFNIAFNQNKVLAIAGDIGNLTAFGAIYDKGNAISLSKGYGLGQFFGYQAAGVDPATGKQLYVNKNGEQVDYSGLVPSDRKFIGSALPTFTYGMTNTFSYKNFDLSVFLQGSQGNKIYNGVRSETESMKDSRNQSTAVLRRWRKAGDITDIPGVERASDNNSAISTRFLENGSYLRFKTITLSYRLDQKLMSKIGFKGASVYISGQNLFTITKYTGFDPEVSSYGSSNNSQDNRNVSLGIDYGAYPQAKIFLAGINVNL